MKIEWDKVTHVSQIVAVVLFVGVFAWGVFVERKVGVGAVFGGKVADVVFECADNQSIHAVFYKYGAHIALSSGPEAYLPQVISASGARYSSVAEPWVFWNKGNTAFVTEGGPDNQTYKDCVIKTP